MRPSLHIDYKNLDLKQYFKEGRGCRTEGTFRNPNDFGVNKGLSNLHYLQKIGREINRRLLEVERVSHNSGLSGDSIQRVVQPTVTADGEKAPALQFGKPRVMALFMALPLFHSQPDELRSAAFAAEGAHIPAAKNAPLLLNAAWLEDGAPVHPAGGAGVPPCVPPRRRDVHPSNDAVLPFPLRTPLNRVDAQLDELIYQAFPQSKAS